MANRLRPRSRHPLVAGAIACGLLVGGCGVGARRAPAPSGTSSSAAGMMMSSSPMSSSMMSSSPMTSSMGSSAMRSGSMASPRTTGPGSASGSGAATNGAQYVQYYRVNGTAGIGAGVPLAMKAGDFSFSPNTLTVKAGTRVHINVTNTSPEPHNFSLQAFGVNVNLPPGTTTPVNFTASRAGTYYFYCNLPGHPQAGMVGRLTVS